MKPPPTWAAEGQNILLPAPSTDRAVIRAVDPQTGAGLIHIPGLGAGDLQSVTPKFLRRCFPITAAGEPDLPKPATLKSSAATKERSHAAREADVLAALSDLTEQTVEEIAFKSFTSSSEARIVLLKLKDQALAFCSADGWLKKANITVADRLRAKPFGASLLRIIQKEPGLKSARVDDRFDAQCYDGASLSDTQNELAALELAALIQNAGAAEGEEAWTITPLGEEALAAFTAEPAAS